MYLGIGFTASKFYLMQVAGSSSGFSNTSFYSFSSNPSPLNSYDGSPYFSSFAGADPGLLAGVGGVSSYPVFFAFAFNFNFNNFFPFFRWWLIAKTLFS